MFRRVSFLIVLVVFALSMGVVWTMPAYADDISDAIEEGLALYKKGEFSEAVQNLDYASQLIRQKKSDKLKTLLPEAPEGWTAEESSSEAMTGAMFGGAVAARRTYIKDSSRMNIEIITDSPMLQGMMMMFNNPMFATSDGGRLTKIAGRKAIMKYSDSGREGDIRIVVADRFLVNVSGTDVSKEELTNFAEKINYEEMAKLP